MNAQDALDEFKLALQVRRGILRANCRRHPDSLIMEGQELEAGFILGFLDEAIAKHSRQVPYPKYCTMEDQCQGKNLCQKELNCCE